MQKQTNERIITLKEATNTAKQNVGLKEESYLDPIYKQRVFKSVAASNKEDKSLLNKHDEESTIDIIIWIR